MTSPLSIPKISQFSLRYELISMALTILVLKISETYIETTSLLSQIETLLEDLGYLVLVIFSE